MKNILIGTPIKNAEFFIENLLIQIKNLSYPKKNISLCFIENDSEDDTWQVLNQKINSIIDINEYRKVTILKLDLGFKLKYADRHKIEFSKNRIKNLIILRNFIVNNFLQDNDYLWWIDSDVEIIPNNSLEHLLSFDKDIIMPTYYTNHNFYDCASYAYINNIPIRLGHLPNYLPENQEIFELERCECAALINRKVFDSGLRYFYVDEEYLDLCNNIAGCRLEGVSFSEKAKKNGFNIFGSLKLKIKHCEG